jgi:sugar lactone lactonase YvrE
VSSATDQDSGGAGVLRGRWRPLGPERHELGEGARFLDDRLYFVDLLAGRLLRADPRTETPPEELLVLDVPLGAVAVAGGGLVAAAGTGIARLDLSGNLVWLSRPADGGPVPQRMNDAAADPSGRFWAGSMAWDSTDGAGALHRLDLDGSVRTVLTGLTIPNGPAFSPDGRTMYLADTPRSVIHQYAVDPATGELGERAVFAEVDGSPDGMVVDADGFVWSAIYGSGRLHRYRPSGELVERVQVPARQPTSLAITADPPHLLVVTTATQGLDRVAEHDGHVLTVPVAVAGQSQSAVRARTG